MAFTSTGFILFVAVAAILYYVFPSKKRWTVLLASSYVFYAIASFKGLLYLAGTTVITFFIASAMQKIQNDGNDKAVLIEDKNQRKLYKAHVKKNKKKALAAGIIFCVGVLAVLKYSNFVLFNISSIITLFSSDYVFKPIKYFIPMGLSFYTFSVTSYLFDVYYNKQTAEKSFFKYALFVSWFPSLVQGPINRNSQLHEQFFESDHHFSLENTQFALQRILWGFMKKLVIADRAAQVVSYVFDNYSQLPNYIILFGLVFYSIQLYADFAGGMDVALGVSELFGIKLLENFRQPYFSQSIAEFWRRWHITLGLWMKDYIFYPFSLSKMMLTLGKKLGNKSRYLGRVIPICIGNIIVFLLVGIWHGAQLHFVLYGLFHGGIIAFSILMQPLYDKGIKLFHINSQSKGWQLFRIIRTFYLVNIGCLLDDVTDLHQSLGMTKQLFSLSNWNLIKNFSFEGFGAKTIFVVLLFSLIWFIVSVKKEQGVEIRKDIASTNVVIRWTIYLFLILATPFFQSSNMAGFMYAQF